MKQTYTNEQVRRCCTAYANGQSVSELAKKLDIPKSTIYTWIKHEQQQLEEQCEKLPLKSYRLLEQKVKRLENTIEILKSVLPPASLPLHEKVKLIEQLQKKYSLRMICDALGFNRGTYYYRVLRDNQTLYEKRKEELKPLVQKIYDDNHQVFGAEKITAILKEQGEPITVPTVRALMHEMGLLSVRLTAKTLYDREHKKPPMNLLNQQFYVEQPNQVWVSDVTQFRLNEKTYYICAIIDLFARSVIAYRIGMRNSTHLTKSTFKDAYETRQPKGPLLFHTDRGANYRSKAFCTYLSSLGVQQSFSRSHNPFDNSVMESFFASFKREELYRTKYRSEYEFRTAIEKYIEFYNKRRPHRKNKYKSPYQKEVEFFSKQKDLNQKEN
ncbi:MAG: IS3 family transposase [Clostridia bacterium]|nr:IS3 family transposase [Clostridia bacterium]